MAVVWEDVVSNMASLLQIMAVLHLLLRLADEVLRLRACKLECDRLKHSISHLQQLLPATTTTAGGSYVVASSASNQQDVDAEVAMRTLGLGTANLEPTIDAANDLVDTYNSSSILHLIRNSRRMKRDMLEMRHRATAYYELLGCIHAGVAVSSATHAQTS